MNEENINCVLCERPLSMPFDDHHLIPKSKGGVKTVTLHRICHSKIHSIFSRTELKQKYNSIEEIKKHAEIKKFVTWISKKPASFYRRTKKQRA